MMSRVVSFRGSILPLDGASPISLTLRLFRDVSNRVDN